MTRRRARVCEVSEAKLRALWDAGPPPSGWQERTHYVVDVQWNSANPVHRAILYTGFMNGPFATPGGYSCVYNPTYEPPHQPVGELYSVRFVSEIEEMKRPLPTPTRC